MKRELFTKKEESVPGLKVLENEDLKSVSGGVTLDKHNDVPVNMVNRVFETDNRYPIVQASDPNDLTNLTNTIKFGMQEEIDRINQEMPELQTPDENIIDNLEYAGKNYDINAELPKTVSDHVDIEKALNMDAWAGEIDKLISEPKLVQANQNPFDN